MAQTGQQWQSGGGVATSDQVGVPTHKRSGTRRVRVGAGALGAVAAAGVIGAGCIVCLGWALSIDWMKSLIPGRVAMNPVTALAFILAGCSLLARAGTSARWRRLSATASVTFAAAVFVIGAVTIAGYLVGHNLGLDQALFQRQLQSNRIAPNTGLNFLLTGAALIIAHTQQSWLQRFVHPLTFTAVFIASLAILGYAYGVLAFYGVGSYIPMALNTALVFIALCLAIFTTYPNQALMAVLIGVDSGSIMARRLLLAAVSIPILLGWLGLVGNHAGFYDFKFGVSLMVTSIIVVFTALILVTAQALNRADTRRREAQGEIGRLCEELELANQRLAGLAYRDGLTGLYNRRTFDERLSNELTRATRYQRGLALLMVDIDHFKSVNDGHGHPAGDAVLRAIADIISAHTRRSDWAARYGGEEFAVVLPEADLQGAETVADRMRRAVAGARIPFGTGEISVTISIGIGLVSEHAATVSQLVQSADRALYTAKHSGRDRYCFAS